MRKFIFTESQLKKVIDIVINESRTDKKDVVKPVKKVTPKKK